MLNPEFDISEESLSGQNMKAYGMFSSFLSGVLFGYVTFSLRKLKNEHFITLTHVFTLTNAPFIPTLFIFQELVSPNLVEWGVMCGIGWVFLFVLMFFIRSAQLEMPCSSLLVVP